MDKHNIEIKESENWPAKDGSKSALPFLSTNN